MLRYLKPDKTKPSAWLCFLTMRQLPIASCPFSPWQSGMFLGSLILLTGLLGVTAWNVTRSEALTQAHCSTRGLS